MVIETFTGLCGGDSGSVTLLIDKPKKKIMTTSMISYAPLLGIGCVRQMMLVAISLSALFAPVTSFSQQSDRYASISRCFFVYAPMAQVGKAKAIDALRTYATERLVFIRGYMEANQNIPEFQQVFQKNLGVNKAAGILIEENLIRSIRNSDTRGYNLEVAKAEVCDRETGFIKR